MARRHNRPLLPPRPPPIISRTTTGILKNAASLFYSHLIFFLVLSFALYGYRSHLNGAVHNLSSRIDRNPYFQSLIDGEIASVSDFHRFRSHLSSRKRFIPKPTRVPLPQLHRYYGFAGISVSSDLKPTEPKFGGNSSYDDVETFVGWEFVIYRLEWWLGKGNSSFNLLLGVVFITYAFHMFQLLVHYPSIYGVIFHKVVDHLLGMKRPFYCIFWFGHKIAIGWWPSRLILIEWCTRALLSHLMALYFFWNVVDPYTFAKILIRIHFMPVFDLAPWVQGHEWESAVFSVLWFAIDFFCCLVFAIDSWVLIVNERERSSKEVIRQGWRLLGALFYPALMINLLEAVMCGSVGRLVLRVMFGERLAMFLEAMLEVYFKIAWILFYFAAREKASASVGRSFGRRGFEQIVNTIGHA